MSMIRKQLLPWLAAGCLVGLAACSGARPAGPSRPIDEDLVGLVPAKPNLVIVLDMVAVRASSLWPPFSSLAEGEELALVREASGIDPLAVADEIVVVGESNPAEGDAFAMIVKGRFQAAGVVTSFKTQRGQQDVDVAGRPAAGGDGFLLVALTERTVLLGSESLVRRIVAVADQGAPSVRDDADFAGFGRAGDGQAVHFRYRRGPTPPNLDRLGAPRLAIDLGEIGTVDGRLLLGSDRLELAVDVESTNKLDASGLATAVEKERRKLERNMVVVLLGIDWLVQKLEVRVEGTKVGFVLTLGPEELQRLTQLAERISRIKELVQAGEEDEGGAE